MKQIFMPFTEQGDEVDESALKTVFLQELAGEQYAEEVFLDTRDQFGGGELVEVLSEIVETIRAECTDDEFCTWDYDHLEFIIDLSNRYSFTIPRNLLNGLPEQLIILVDAGKLSPPGCP